MLSSTRAPSFENTLLGESPYVALEGTTTRASENTEGRKSQSSGTFHGRFLLDEEMLGKRVRITIEIVKMKPWPNLALRARIRERAAAAATEPTAPPTTEEGRKRAVQEIASRLTSHLGMKVKNVEVIELNRGASGGGGAGGPVSSDPVDSMDEDEYCAHLKTCVSCRADVARAARLGLAVPTRVLQAAGVEVLN